MTRDLGPQYLDPRDSRSLQYDLEVVAALL